MTTTEKAIIPIILIKTLISINLGGGGGVLSLENFFVVSLFIVVNEEILKKYSYKKDHT